MGSICALPQFMSLRTCCVRLCPRSCMQPILYLACQPVLKPFSLSPKCLPCKSHATTVEYILVIIHGCRGLLDSQVVSVLTPFIQCTLLCCYMYVSCVNKSWHENTASAAPVAQPCTCMRSRKPLQVWRYLLTVWSWILRPYLHSDVKRMYMYMCNVFLLIYGT